MNARVCVSDTDTAVILSLDQSVDKIKIVSLRTFTLRKKMTVDLHFAVFEKYPRSVISPCLLLCVGLLINYLKG